MFSLIISNSLPVLISVSTLFGVVVHDTRFDKFATTLLTVPIVVASYEGVDGLLRANDHTHTERVSVSQFAHAFAQEVPRTQARHGEKRYRLEKNVVKGHHPFDNYSLPIVA